MSENDPTDDAAANALPTKALTHSIADEHLTDSLASIGDVGLDAVVSGLHGVPVLGIAVGLLRAGRDIHKELEFKKIVIFLRELGNASPEKRKAFVSGLQRECKLEEFGENILLLLSRMDHMSKPRIVGKILAACVEGKIDYRKAMRLAAIVDRCYAEDLEYLRNFCPGLQAGDEDVAAMLFSAGLLGNRGLDAGSYEDASSGGTLYDLNEYGNLLLSYGL
jgi:hypothetical protein